MDEEILGVHVDLISRKPNDIRFDETEPERASVPNQGTAAIYAIPMETIAVSANGRNDAEI